MRNDQELLVGGEPLQHPIEPDDVRVVERRVHLIQHVEGARIDGLQRKQEGERRQRPLAARQQGERLQPFAGRLCQDLDALVQRVALRLALEAESRAATFEQLAKEFLEVHRHRLEHGPETAVDFLFEPLTQFVELRGGGLEVAQLRRQAVAALAHLRVFLGREQVDGAHRIQAALQSGNLALRLLPVDVLDRLVVILDFLPTFAQRQRAPVHLELRALAVGNRCRPGIVGVRQLDLQGDVALFVVAELRLQGCERVDVRQLRRLERLELGAQRPRGLEPAQALLVDQGRLDGELSLGGPALRQLITM